MKPKLTERSARLRQTLKVFDFGEVSTKSTFAKASVRSLRSFNEGGLEERSRKRKFVVEFNPHTNWLNGMLKGKLVWGSIPTYNLRLRQRNNGRSVNYVVIEGG